MAKYLNPGARSFLEAARSNVFVDKSAMISYLNSLACTKQKYLSVSRPRRFGKTMAADMLCAYYSRQTDARELFESLKLASTQPVTVGGDALAWDAYLGAFDVVRVTISQFLKHGKGIEWCLDRMQRMVVRDLERAYPDIDYFDKSDLTQSMQDVFDEYARPFVVVIDEWDAPIRERRNDGEGHRLYLDFLRDWLKDQEFIALAYMTGILPIKKYGAHSALNMFDEYSMAAPIQLAPYTGFTEQEVGEICRQRGLNFDSVKQWYDGYRLSGAPSKELVANTDPTAYADDASMHVYETYAPLSVVRAVTSRQLANYWSDTETYEALAEYIRMDFDGLKRKVALLMDGGRIPVELSGYQNDLETFNRADDVLALLVHLGYLGWDQGAKLAFIPNREVMDVFRTSTSDSAWDFAFREYERSKELLSATWAKDERRVAELLESAHDQVENKSYHSEVALSYSVQHAYYAARKYYTTVLELDTGKGYADIAYLPAPSHAKRPALLIELKWDNDVRTALDKIRNHRYPDRLEHYAGNLLLVGIAYSRDARPGTPDYRRHTCRIEQA